MRGKIAVTRGDCRPRLGPITGRKKNGDARIVRVIVGCSNDRISCEHNLVFCALLNSCPEFLTDGIEAKSIL